MAPPILGVFLAASVVPLAKKILIGLGIGVVSYAGLNALYGQVEAQVVASWGQLGGSTLQILSLAGFPAAAGIVLSGLSARVALVAVEKFAKISAS